MDALIIQFSPTSDQKVSIYKSHNIVEELYFTFNELIEHIFFLIQKYEIYNINLHGFIPYENKFEQRVREINSVQFTKLNINRI